MSGAFGYGYGAMVPQGMGSYGVQERHVMIPGATRIFGIWAWNLCSQLPHYLNYDGYHQRETEIWKRMLRLFIIMAS
jgi:hypothetical protein